jgi:hypothetical protein
MNYNHEAWKNREAARAAIMDKPPAEPMIMIRARQGPFLLKEKWVSEGLAEWYMVRWAADFRGKGVDVEATNADGTMYRPPRFKAVPASMREMDYYV